MDSNTYVDKTLLEPGDWHGGKLLVGLGQITFSLDLTDPHKAALFLGIDLFESLREEKWGTEERGWYGYKVRYTSRYADIYYDERPNPRKVRITMDGTASAEYQRQFGIERVRSLIVNAWRDGMIHRLDVFIDDHAGLLTYKKVLSHVNRGAYRSHLRPDTSLAGAIYWGSGTSNFLIRMYDKRREQARRTKGLPDPNGLPWFRIELQGRGGKAAELAREIAESDTFSIGIRKVLGRAITLTRKPRKAKPKQRWGIDPEWRELMKGIDRVKPTRATKQQSEDRTRQWVENKVAPSLNLLVRKHGRRYLEDLLQVGDEKLKPKHEKHLDQDKRRDCLPLEEIPQGYGPDGTPLAQVISLTAARRRRSRESLRNGPADKA
jgi:hypothetical protein